MRPDDRLVLHLPDGAPAPDNTALVAAARQVLAASGQPRWADQDCQHALSDLAACQAPDVAAGLTEVPPVARTPWAAPGEPHKTHAGVVVTGMSAVLCRWRAPAPARPRAVLHLFVQALREHLSVLCAAGVPPTPQAQAVLLQRAPRALLVRVLARLLATKTAQIALHTGSDLFSQARPGGCRAPHPPPEGLRR